MIILKFFSFIILLILVLLFVAMGMAWKVFRVVRGAKKSFRDGMGGMGGNTRHENVRHRSTTTAGGDTIIDTRDREHANQKIFGKDDGEYVDFQEK